MASYWLRVWFAPEEMKGGQKLYDQIERAIQLHDRLLVVLSESSMQSDWVITEIQRAREAELKEKRRKLFPIAIVGFDEMPWAMSLRPPLTTVAQPAFDVGRTAAELFLARVREPALPRRQVVL